MESKPTSQLAAAEKGPKANVLLYLTDRIGPEAILPCLLPNSDIDIRVIRKQRRADLGDDNYKSFPEVEVYENIPFATWEEDCVQLAQQSHQHGRWADVLFVEMDADTVSAMLAGLAYSTILSILRCWDVSKKVVILPELSIDQWRSPIWKRQMTEIQIRWPWLQLLRPARWDVTGEEARTTDQRTEYTWDWEGPGEAIKAIKTEAKKIIRNRQSVKPPISENTVQTCDNLTIAKQRSPSSSTKPRSKLPPEIWTIILEYLGDWEYATALGIYTTLPTPYEWLPHIPRSPSRPQTFEYTLLTSPTQTIITTLDTNSTIRPPTTLSALAIKLIFKFSLTRILSHLATHQKDIFWTSFDLFLIPHKASIIYNSPTILEWWRSEPAILKKEYGPEALDGASRAGFVDVLDWWLHSGLELRYTEKALESASAKGHVHVLDWWKKTSTARDEAIRLQQPLPPLPLKVGKSLLSAAQSGRTASITWWHHSGIPFSHEDALPRLASTHGHVAVLELWRALQGPKMIFDHQVLVGATKNGHADVLEWWKTRSGVRVEYKTCDIEEAMEDSLGGGEGEGRVREWWERNGLNLGVGTSEWMRVKTLGG